MSNILCNKHYCIKSTDVGNTDSFRIPLSVKKYSVQNMKIQKSPFQTDDPLFFKDFPSKNIPFENASPKNGKFIDWDFT